MLQANMAARKNRFALFSEADVEMPARGPALDGSLNPFLNQIADDSIPWQQVKKRGGPPVQRVQEASAAATSTSTSTGSSTVTKESKKAAPARGESDNKAYDQHENWCGVCHQHFSSKSLLQAHIKASTSHQHYCNLCKRVFKDRNGLKNHVEHAKDHDVSCNLCLSAFKDEWGPQEPL